MTEPTGSFYVTGGTLKPGEPSYVERRADTELFESLLAGELCYVLTARQMGKSSLMARTAKRLEQVGVASAIVDLTQLGSERGSQAAAQWYFGVANKIHQQLKIAEPLRPWWQERADLSSIQRLTDFFREIVLPHHPGKVVIFVDEIDSTIGLPFADDFFAAVRACFNARATEPNFERLTFVLLGVAAPDQLIRDQTRTPFNIGKRIDLTDFSPEEAAALAPGLHAEPGEADRRLERVLHWTGGHPYLTQALCRAVREKDPGGTAEQAVDPRVQELFLTSQAQREETNLKHARARLEKPGAEGRRLLQLYRSVRQGKSVPDQPTSPLFAQLKLAGVVKATGDGRLAVRNRIYAAVFTPEWAKSVMPADRGRRLAAATLAASLAALGVWYSVFQPRPYEQALRAAIKDDGYNGAIAAYTALRANPFSRSRATELMQQFWEQRGLRFALAGERDKSLLSYLQGLSLRDSEPLRKKAQNLVGLDYEQLRMTLHHGQIATRAILRYRGRDLQSVELLKSPELSLPPDGETALLAPLLVSGFPAFTASADGRTFAAFHTSGNVRVWDSGSGKTLALLRGASTFPGRSGALALSPDGRTLAVISKPPAIPNRADVQIWDVRTGRITLSLPSVGTRSIAFSPTGKHIAIGSYDGSCRIRDIRTGKLQLYFVSHREPIQSVAFSRGGQWLATGSWDETAQIWNAHTGQPATPPFQHGGSVYGVAFSLDGGTLATGGSDRTARIWSINPLSPARQLLENGQKRVYTSRFNPDGRVTVRSFGETLQIFDSRSEEQLGTPLRHPSHVYAIEISPDGNTLATGAGDGTVRLWDAHTGKPLAHRKFSKEAIVGLAFSSQGKTLAVGSYDSRVQIWDIAAGTSRTLVRRSSEPIPIWSLTFSPDGSTLAGGSEEGSAELWEVRTGFGGQLQHGDHSTVMVAFSTDSQILAAASLRVQLWSAKTGRPLSAPLPLQEEAMSIAFRPDGKGFFVATARWLNTYSWDGEKVKPQSSQMLHGFWNGAFQFDSACKACLRVALEDTSKPFHLETLNLDQPNDPPIEGDPKDLLKEWQERLGMTFDDEMRPVPKPSDDP